jgi:hypothetical protein
MPLMTLKEFSALIDRDKHLYTRVKEHYDYAVAQGYEVVCCMLQGSQNYGLDVYTDEYKSDIDTKAIVLPKFDDFCRMKDPISTTLILPNNEHCDIKDIRVMFKTFEKQNINFLEILFTEYFFVNPKYKQLVSYMFSLADDVASINWNQALNCISGMSHQKLNAMEHRYPTIADKIDKYGYDPKQLHHIIRMNDFIKKFVAGKPYRECLVPDNIEYLKEIKTKPMPLEEARKLAVETDKETHEIKQEHLKDDNVIRDDVIDKLKWLSCEFIKKYIKEQLLEEREYV